MTSQSNCPACESGRTRTSRFIRVDEREMKRAPGKMVSEIPLDSTGRGRSGHRNATARNANSATDIATLLNVCS